MKKENVLIGVGVVLALALVFGLIGWRISYNTTYEPTLIAADKGDSIEVVANFPLTGHGKLFFEYHHVALTRQGSSDVLVASNQIDARSGEAIVIPKPFGANGVRLRADDRAFWGPSSETAVLNWATKN